MRYTMIKKRNATDRGFDPVIYCFVRPKYQSLIFYIRIKKIKKKSSQPPTASFAKNKKKAEKKKPTHRASPPRTRARPPLHASARAAASQAPRGSSEPGPTRAAAPQARAREVAAAPQSPRAGGRHRRRSESRRRRPPRARRASRCRLEISAPRSCRRELGTEGAAVATSSAWEETLPLRGRRGRCRRRSAIPHRSSSAVAAHARFSDLRQRNPATPRARFVRLRRPDLL